MNSIFIHKPYVTTLKRCRTATIWYLDCSYFDRLRPVSVLTWYYYDMIWSAMYRVRTVFVLWSYLTVCNIYQWCLSIKCCRTHLTGMFYTTSLIHVVDILYIRIEYDCSTNTIYCTLNRIVMELGQLWHWLRAKIFGAPNLLHRKNLGDSARRIFSLAANVRTFQVRLTWHIASE
jgi:hypothetical protein